MAQLKMDDLKKNKDITNYLIRADQTLLAMGYTEHSIAHVSWVADKSSKLLEQLGYDKRTCELTQVAGYLHDIGNMVNRNDHAHSGALIAFKLLSDMGMPSEEVALVVSAIGHHDEKTAFPVDAVVSAIILADKCDVRRSRVRNPDMISFDIHDRVNYAVSKSEMLVDVNERTLTLSLKLDTNICPVMEYFEIFLDRMMLCRKAAQNLGLTFKMQINGAVIL